jgi:Protein of unknown function (DUF1176)
MSLRLTLLLPFAACISATVVAPAAAQTPQLGAQVFFADWGVGCDNTLSCEAVALQPENDANDDLLSLVIGRNAETGELTVTAIGEASKNDRYSFRIDRRLVQSGPMTTAGDGTITLNGTDALKLVRAIVRGRELRLEDSQGRLLGKASLRGSAAALRHIDIVQNRGGTRDALAVPGRKAKPARFLAAPVVTAKRIGAEGPTPDATAIIAHVESTGCAKERQDLSEDSAYSLGQSGDTARALVLVNCGAGAYNVSSVAYIAKRVGEGRWTFERARYDHDPVPPDDVGGPYLINAAWMAEKQELSNFSKARGIGDCGSSESYVWDGAMFRLIEAYGMQECRGSLDWMQLWRADVRLVD